MTLANVLCKNRYLFRAKTISCLWHVAGSLYVLGMFFKISDEHDRPFYVGVSGLDYTPSFPVNNI